MLKALRDQIAKLPITEHDDYNVEFVALRDVLKLVDAAIAQRPGGWPSDMALMEGPDGVPQFVPIASLNLVPREVKRG